MRAIRWAFGWSDDEADYFDGFTDGSEWNGFDNVWISPTVRDEVVARLRSFGTVDEADSANEIAALPVDNGLVSLANGFATCEVES